MGLSGRTGGIGSRWHPGGRNNRPTGSVHGFGKVAAGQVGLGRESHAQRHLLQRFVIAFISVMTGLVALPIAASASVQVPPLHQLGSSTNSVPILFVMCNWGSRWNYQPNNTAFYDDLWFDQTSGGYHSLA